MSRQRVLLAAMAGVRGGPRTYALSLARRLPSAAPDLDFLLLSEVPPEGPIGMPSRTLALPHPVLRPLWDHLGVPAVIRATGADLYHNTKNALPLIAPGRQVVTIHDLAPYRTPETFSPASRAYLTFHTSRAARTADAVIAVSESTKRDLVEVLGVDGGKIHVVPNGVDDRFHAGATDRHEEVLERYRLAKPFALYTGTIQPRKNPDVVLDAFLALPPAVRDAHSLVFAGRIGWKAARFRERIRDARRVADVRHLPGVPDAELVDLYAGATAFLSPSSYEGFGLTVAEAMAAGTAVVAGDVSSLPEVVGDAGLLVPPRDVDAVRDALLRLLTDEALRRDLEERGRKRARAFTWERTASLTAEVYRKVLAVDNR